MLLITAVLKIENADNFLDAFKTNKVPNEILEDDFGGKLHFPCQCITTPVQCLVQYSLHNSKSVPIYMNSPLTKLHRDYEFAFRFLTDHLLIIYAGLESKTPDTFVVCETNKLNEEMLDHQKGSKLSPPPSSFHQVLKCPPSSKSAWASGTKRPASWRQTRSHQSRVGPDPHDDFLDTPLENVRANINKVSNKEDPPDSIQGDVSMESSDDETQDLNAKISPQKKQSSITLASKKNFKYIEPVRKKAERENLKGVECKQCKKFYDAVLPNGDGKDPDGSKRSWRCEHLDGVSRHRYRYVPPMTPEGFWNIGFESEL